MRLLLYLFFISPIFSHSQNVIFAKANDTIRSFTIYSYQSNNTKTFTDEISVKELNDIIEYADSSFFAYSFYLDRLDSKNLVGNTYQVNSNLNLNTIILGSKKSIINIGPTKAKRIPTIYGRNSIGAIGFKIDSTTALRRLEGINFYFRGSGLFVPEKSFNSKIEIVLYHTTSVNDEHLTNLIPNHNTFYVVDFRGKNWLEVNLSELNIQLPKSGYIVYGFKNLSNEIVITTNKKEKNPGLDYVHVYNSNDKLKFKIAKPTTIPLHLPRIILVLSEYK